MQGDQVENHNFSGYVQLESSHVTKNMADGVKYYFHDQKPETKMVDGVDVHDFCTYSTTYSQTYPFLMVAEQYEDSAVDRYSSGFGAGSSCKLPIELFSVRL
jgi:hypothetical protein